MLERSWSTKAAIFGVLKVTVAEADGIITEVIKIHAAHDRKTDYLPKKLQIMGVE